MGFMSLCSGDPVETLLRRTFKADIMRVPDARVQPLGTIARRGANARLWGDLSPLLQGPSPLTLKAGAATPLPDLRGMQTSAVDMDVGMDLLGGFLQGFGVATDALKLKAALGATRKLTFSFEEVERVSIAPALLGRALGDRKLQIDGTATKLFLVDGPWGAPYELLIISSVLRSGCFKIHLQETRKQEVALALPQIQGVLGNTEVTVEQSADQEVSFRRSEKKGAPTFAFTTLRVYLQADGAMTLAPASHRGGLESMEVAVEPLQQRILGDHSGLVTFDEVASAQRGA